jgi:hypothetical protein
MEDEKTPAGLARFGLKMMPELADIISENGGPNVEDLDMEDDTVANNIGAAVAMARFTQTVLDDITERPREQGPAVRGRQAPHVPRATSAGGTTAHAAGSHQGGSHRGVRRGHPPGVGRGTQRHVEFEPGD